MKLDTQEGSTGSEQTQNDQGSEGSGDQTDKVTEQLNQLQNNQADLTRMMESFLATQQKKTDEPIGITAEQFSEMMKKDPQAAVQAVLAKTIKDEVDKSARVFEHTAERKHWDSKAEIDFPALTQDKAFLSDVQKEVADLVAGGMPKNSPKLIYKAAELAALKSGKKPVSVGSPYAGMSGMAPSSGGKKVTQLDAQQQQLQKMFGLKDQAKLISKIQHYSDRGGKR